MAPNATTLPACTLRAALMATALGLVLPAAASAETGAIAYARPASGIVIDGDLSDWPANAQRFEINTTLGRDEWRDPAYFQAAWDPSGRYLYVAVVVDDESTVFDPEAGWTQQDSHLLYVDATHSPRGSGSWVMAASVEAVSNVTNPKGWDPQTARATQDAITMVAGEQDGMRVLEWRVELDQPVRAGMSIGIDHVMVDNDDIEGVPSSFGSWGPYPAKSRRAARMGDLILLGGADRLGTFTGTMGWAQPVEDWTMSGTRARIYDVDDPELWVNVTADESGRYTVDLPPGHYCAQPAFMLLGSRSQYRIRDDVQSCATVVGGQQTEAAHMSWVTQPEPEALIAESGMLFDFDASDAQRLDAFMDAYMHHFTIPGASVSIIREGQVVYERHYGVTNWLTQEPVGPQHLFDMGSITKAVFAFAVHRLAEQGVIDLDRPLHEYMPFEDIAHDERSQLFTARLVLSHQTGLPNWRWQTDTGELDIAFTPGEGWRYSGEGYDYLGRVIEHLTGDTLEDVLMREAVEPLGMDPSVRFSLRDNWHDVFVVGHTELRAFAAETPDEAHAAYSMMASTNDLAQVLMTWMQRGGGLSEAGYEAMFEAQVDTGDTATDTNWPRIYAMGPSTIETPHGRAIGHGGVNWGQNTLMEFYEDHDAGFVLATNGDAGWHVRDALRRFLVAGREHTVLEVED